MPIRLSIGKVRAIAIDPHLDTIKRSIDPSGFNIRLSPNPNRGIFAVELSRPAVPDMFFKITDLLGRLIIEKQADIGSKTQPIDATSLDQGLYLLQVVVEGKVRAVKKFVKQ